MISTLRKPTAAVAFLVAGAFYFVTGTLYGMLSAIHLMAPQLFSNIAFATMGRSRPVHVNTMVYGFVTTTLLGAALYYVPAVLRTRLWSEKLGWAAFVLWNVSVLSGYVTFPFGITQGREYTEYIYPFDITLMLALGAVLFNFVMTIATRRENTLYVSSWYATGAMLWTAGVYPIGNAMWNTEGAVPGVLDSIFLWFYAHNLVGLLLTPLALGALFFIIPRLSRTPLYSHTLSLIGFFGLVALYTHIGGHHILQMPIPTWLKTVAIVDSMGMLVPVFVPLTNLWLTVRGRVGLVWSDVAGRFAFTGSLWYLVTCIQGPLQSLPSVQELTHFNNWVIGHSHIAVLGFSGFIALGALWHVLPLASGRELYSKNLVSVQFGLTMIGLGGFFLVLTIAGLIQGQMWHNGFSEYNVLPLLRPYMVLRAMFGIFLVSASLVGLWNVAMTLWRGSPLLPTPPLEEAPR